MSELKPVTRKEAYWAAVADDSVTPPEPQTTEECILAAMSGNYPIEDIKPQTRMQGLMKKAAEKMGESADASAAINALIERTITEISNDEVTSIGKNAFQCCTSLSAAKFLSVTSIRLAAFYGCTSLISVDLPLATSIGGNVFYDCKKLTAIILRSETMCTLDATTTFKNTPIESGTGYIYVPAALVNTYKTATNWSTYADQIRAIEDYPEICG